MLTLNLNPQKMALASLKPVLILALITLFTCTAEAQLPGQLPVNLKAFKARAETRNKVKIFWTTEYEKDNGYFDIERSVDGINFTKTGRIPGMNNNGLLTDYYYYDLNAMKGISFYRLKQVDIDGKFSYSPIERVNNSETDNSFDVYPNPATGNSFKINLLKNTSAGTELLVFDQAGRLQLKQELSNSNTINIQHRLPAGMYTIKVNDKDINTTKKLVIQ